MSESRTKRNFISKILRIVFSSLFHLGFLGILLFAFIVSLDEDKMFDLALESITFIEDVKYVMGGLLTFYFFVISLHFIEIVVEVRQTRTAGKLRKEITELKAQLYVLTKEEESREEKMQAFRDSLEE